MSVENPTGGDAGASIEDRLERLLAAQDAPAQNPQQAQAADDGSDDVNDDQAPAANADTPGTPSGDAQEDGEGPQLTTADLAKMLGIDESALDVSDDGAVLVKTKIDGKDGAAKFSDFLKSYQMTGHVENRVREAAEREKAQQLQAQQAQQAITAKLDELDKVIAYSGKQLLQEFQSVDWQALRAADPGEYAARVQDFNARQAELDKIASASQTERQQIQHKQQQELQEFINKEAQSLPQVIPEWADNAVARKDMTDMRDWAVKNGFDPQEVAGIVRAPHLAAIRKAMLFDRLQAAKPNIENRVRSAPKIVKPGQAQQVSRDQQHIRTLKSNVRNSGGKTADVAELLLARGHA